MMQNNGQTAITAMVKDASSTLSSLSVSRRRISSSSRSIAATATTMLALLLLLACSDPTLTARAFQGPAAATGAHRGSQRVLVSKHQQQWTKTIGTSSRNFLVSSTSSKKRTASLSSFTKLGLFNFGGGNDEATAAVELTEDTEPQLYPQRWIQLAYLSILALLSDWICFSVAASPDVYEKAFSHSAAQIIDIFLFTNVLTCFLVTDIINRFGLQKAIQAASLLMAVGCWFRSGISFLPVIPGTEHLMSYTSVLIGTILVGAAQPFFQCTPPVLSATWFAPSERATSTAIALNFNQIGIATAFVVGGLMATNNQGMETYFGLIAVLATLTAIGTVLQFQDEPLIPPSSSEIEKRITGEQEPPFLDSVSRFFQKRGFARPLTAFICSITITNVVGAFVAEVMTRGGVTDRLSVDLAGAGFELAILVGGIILGGYVDRTKEYKKVTLACLAVTACMCIPLGLTDHALGKEPALLVAALLGLGISAGPIQPINAELAVDVAYPGDETAVESVQQIGGNLVSALLVPVAELLSKRDFTLLQGVPGLESDVRGDVILLMSLALLTMGYFSTFDSPLARSMADTAGEESAKNRKDLLNADNGDAEIRDRVTADEVKSAMFYADKD